MLIIASGKSVKGCVEPVAHRAGNNVALVPRIVDKSNTTITSYFRVRPRQDDKSPRGHVADLVFVKEFLQEIAASKLLQKVLFLIFVISQRKVRF